MKSARQIKILEIIKDNVIVTQDDLIQALKKEGVESTQATTSRDIRQLRLLKVEVDGVYRYVAPQTENGNAFEYHHALFASVKSIKCALNNVVIKTGPGLAQAVAAGIDTLNEEDVLGCIAGDDTILVITSSEQSAVTFAEKMEKLAK